MTFPADLKANVNMRTDNGEVYSDFDVQLTAVAPQQEVEDGRSQGGKYRVKVDKTVRGKINGGARKSNSRTSTATSTSAKLVQIADSSDEYNFLLSELLPIYALRLRVCSTTAADLWAAHRAGWMRGIPELMKRIADA